ncbi:hypothetical protein [Piscinibacter sp. XHJ-5]|uniref:hypothetical protein n=1 Tax=Piscinibacter sp. XHJ-5 TaxID=3037797 RepID=UPI002452AD75|nr:hypothetical protein [Piscinibacter sp. XHJ-5]
MSPNALALALVLAIASLTLPATPALARGGAVDARAGVQVGHHHHGGHGHGRHGAHHHHHWRGSVWLGFGLGWPYAPYWHDPWYPGHAVIERAPLPAPVAAPVPAAPDPKFVAGQGQDWRQTEYDRQACNRWAMTQADAVADAQVFHRTSLACMEARGYAVRQ